MSDIQRDENGRFPKGVSGNRKGRPLNKRYVEIRNALANLSIKNLPKFERKLNEIEEPQPFVFSFLAMLKHFMPPTPPEPPVQENQSIRVILPSDKETPFESEIIPAEELEQLKSEYSLLIRRMKQLEKKYSPE